MAKRFTKTEELTLFIALRSCADKGLVAYYTDSDFHCETFHQDVEELLATILEIRHKVN